MRELNEYIEEGLLTNPSIDLDDIAALMEWLVDGRIGIHGLENPARAREYLIEAISREGKDIYILDVSKLIPENVSTNIVTFFFDRQCPLDLRVINRNYNMDITINIVIERKCDRKWCRYISEVFEGIKVTNLMLPEGGTVDELVMSMNFLRIVPQKNLDGSTRNVKNPVIIKDVKLTGKFDNFNSGTGIEVIGISNKDPRIEVSLDHDPLVILKFMANGMGDEIIQEMGELSQARPNSKIIVRPKQWAFTVGGSLRGSRVSVPKNISDWLDSLVPQVKGTRTICEYVFVLQKSYEVDLDYNSKAGGHGMRKIESVSFTRTPDGKWHSPLTSFA